MSYIHFGLITRQDKNQAQAIATQLILQYNFVIIIATQNDIIALCYDSCALCADTISTLCPFFLHLSFFLYHVNISRDNVSRQIKIRHHLKSKAHRAPFGTGRTRAVNSAAPKPRVIPHTVGSDHRRSPPPP